jgi:serine/threonine-protein kinase
MTLTTSSDPRIGAADEVPTPPDASDQQPADGAASGAFSTHVVAGRYRLIEPLGRGGMGRVYRGHDDLLDRPVAVKLIYDDAVSPRDQRRACAVEARAAARVTHPGVVRILDSGFDDGHCFVVMELAEGQTLAAIIHERGPLPLGRALGIAAQVADALDEAHRQGVIHCDVKPGNLIVDPYGRVRLVDFGIARVSSSSTGLTDQDMHGSARYVAPEQVEGGDIDGRTDVYALGVVLFEMLAGRAPFTGGNLAAVLAQRLVADPPSVQAVRPAIPAGIDALVRRAMAREPDDRFQTAGALRDALRHALMGLGDTDPASEPEVALSQTAPVVRPEHGARASHPQSAPVAPLGERLGQAGARLKSSARARFDRIGAPGIHPAGTGRTRIPTFPVRWPTLPSAVGILALLGLLAGMAAAQCGMAGVSTDDALALRSDVAPVEALAAPATALSEPPAPPIVAPTLIPPPATSAPVIQPTEPPPTEAPTVATAATPPPAPTAAPPAPTAAPPAEPPRVAAPAEQPAAPPLQTLAGPAPAPAPAQAEDVADDDADADAPEDSAPTADRASAHSQGKPHDKKPAQPLPAAQPAAKPAPPAPAVPASALPAPAPAPKPPAPPPAPKPQAPPPAQTKKPAAPAPPPPAPKPAGNPQHGGGNSHDGGNGRGRGH